jgi:predicted RNase H-like nuclease
MILGVDGANGGWLVAEYDGTYSFSYIPSFFSVWKEYGIDADEKPEGVLVDVPIGLRNDGEPRECDTEARKRVRNGTVYPTPCRPVLYEDTYEEAKATNEEMTGGKSLTTQTWSIIPLIREVDNVLDEYEEARGIVREAHPELCFWALNDGETVKSKKQTREGYEERLRILGEQSPEVRKAAEAATERFEDTGVKPDDVADALALAVTAQGKLRTIPENPPTDEQGLPMEMVLRETV